MAKAVQWAVYGTSALAHLGLALAVERVEAQPPAPPPPISITVSEPPPEPPPPPEDPPEPPEPPPEPETPELEELAPPPPTPKPKPPRPEPAPAPPAAAPMPAYGMSGGSTGTAVPSGSLAGDPSAKREPEPEPPKRTVKKAKTLEPPQAKADACAEEDTKPRPLSMPQPEYTDAARAAGIAGKVRVEVAIDATGAVERVKVIGALDPGLDAAAVRAIETAKFEPATRCGQPVPATFKISVKFAL